MLAFSLVFLCGFAIAESVDPCNENGHRHIPNEGSRYVNFMINTPFHDSRLLESWYYVGNDTMPETPPESLFSCGTKFPIWLDGSHPTDTKEVTRKACLMTLMENCSSIYDVQIKFCKQKGVYLYHLKPTRGTTEGYCFGTGIPGSATSFVPSKPKASFILNNMSILQLPVSYVIFKCDFGVQTSEPLWYRVSWWREGNIVYTTQYAKNNSDDTLFLNETLFVKYGFVMGEHIACSVRAFKIIQGPPGKPSQTSDALFVGIKIKTPSLSFTIGEKDVSKRTIVLQPTVPIGCQAGNACSLWLVTYTNASEFEQCQGIAIEKSSCGVKIDSSSYDSDLKIPVTTSETGKYQTKDGSYDVYFKTDETKENQIWLNYKLPPIKVHVAVSKTSYPGKTCYAVPDPHMLTFDGLAFENHQDGVYTLYKHTVYDAEIQIQHEKCNGDNIRCPCGVAARAGLDRYVISFCNNQMDIDYKACVRDRSIIVKSIDMYKYKIVLPHGTYVEVSIKDVSWGININGGKRALYVYVKPSLHDDKAASRGLCGKLDNNCVNDFHYTDGRTITTESTLCGGNSYIQPLEFIQTWRVKSDSENLFHPNYNVQLAKPWVFKLCGCFEPPPVQAGTEYVKNEAPCQRNTVAECTRGKVVNSHSCAHPVLNRRSVRGLAVKPIVHIPHTAMQLREKRRASKNWTETDARSYCYEQMQTSPVFHLCGKIPNALSNDTVENCIKDILLTNGVEWTSLAVDSMRGSCLSELERNTTLREKSGSQPSIAEMIEDKACANNCSGAGICVKGECRCTASFGGFDCSLDLSVGPTISGLLDNGLCDEQHIECDHAYVFGHVFTDDTNLTCRLEEFSISFKGIRMSGNTHYLPGEFETLIEVNCALNRVRSRRSMTGSTDHEEFVFGYTLSVSNDGNHFQDGHDLFVYNSECQQVSNDSGRFLFNLMDGYCFIENRCVRNGSQDGNNTCSICLSNTLPLAWSLDKSYTGCVNITQVKIDTDTKQKYLWIIGVVGGVVAGGIIAVVVFVKNSRKR